MTEFTDLHQRLCAHFPINAVSWRVGTTNRKKVQRAEGANAKPTKGQALAYIDARDVMDRLDEVVGPENWQDRYPHANTKTVCEIGIKVGDEWIWKSDGAGDSDIEAAKGALSDAFKRAAVRWGIGRYLYDLPSPWVDIDEWGRIKESEMGRLRQMLQRLSEGTVMPQPATGQVAVKSSAAAKRDGKWDEVVQRIREAPTREELHTLATDVYGDWIASIPQEWKEQLTEIYEGRLHELKGMAA